MHRLLRMTETHMRWRENGKVPMAIATHSIRLVVREAGRRLAARGRLDSPEDVVHLRLTELVDELAGRPVTDLTATVKRRRETLELAAALPMPEMLDVHPGRLSTISAQRWRSLGVLPPAEVDAGGPMSHSAIAAREIGIPCVLNVKEATTRIREGQRVTVDGDAGVVELHKD